MSSLVAEDLIVRHGASVNRQVVCRRVADCFPITLWTSVVSSLHHHGHISGFFRLLI
jgi:hypothetical protein